MQAVNRILCVRHFILVSSCNDIFVIFLVVAVVMQLLLLLLQLQPLLQRDHGDHVYQPDHVRCLQEGLVMPRVCQCLLEHNVSQSVTAVALPSGRCLSNVTMMDVKNIPFHLYLRMVLLCPVYTKRHHVSLI